MEFRAGEVVQLKSGGEKMTVRVVENGEAWCDWLDTVGVAHQASFPLSSLHKAGEELLLSNPSP